MYRIFEFLGIRRVCSISVGVHATRVSVRVSAHSRCHGGGVVLGCCSSVFAGDCQPLGPRVKRLKW